MNAIYLRTSTDKQDYAQQKKCVNDYLKRMNVSTELYTVEEKISGTVKHEKRKLNELMERCGKGSTIYISELSRLGRSMTDLFAIVTYCGEHDITIIQCKDGTTIENKSIGGKALLFALSLAAEIEVENIRQRTRAGLAARRERLQAVGGTNELWGKNKGTNRKVCIAKMQEVSSSKRKENARMNSNNAFFWTFISQWINDRGEPKKSEIWAEIALKLNELNQHTSTGLEYNASRAAAMYRNLKRIMK